MLLTRKSEGQAQAVNPLARAATSLAAKTIDRRTFLKGTGLTAGAAAFASQLPLNMGTIGVEGAYRAMREGYVDEEWAREHHSLWYEEVRQGRRPERIVGPTVQPVAGDD